jgi:hypothetical protein
VRGGIGGSFELKHICKKKASVLNETVRRPLWYPFDTINMKILLVTPRFPPDPGVGAEYAKEMAARLGCMHTVTTLTYGNLPEHVQNVRVVTVQNRTSTLTRVIRFTHALIRDAKNADACIILNGSSVELPYVFASWFQNQRTILCLSDNDAIAIGSQNFIRRHITNCAKKRASHILAASPLIKPEILPFLPYPTDELRAYELWWDAHVANIMSHLTVKL